MYEQPLLSLDQVSFATHSFEEIGHGCVIITDKAAGHRFLLRPMDAPYYLSPEDAAFLEKYVHENRAFTPAEQELLLAHAIPPSATFLADNRDVVAKWCAAVEARVGPLSHKPTPQESQSTLFWSESAVEVILKSGEVNSFALVQQRAPILPSEVENPPILLSDVASIRPSPYAVPIAVLTGTGSGTVEEHMGDAFYLAETGDKLYALDANSQFRSQGLFFKCGDVTGSQLRPTSAKMEDHMELISDKGARSEPVTITYVEGLW